MSERLSMSFLALVLAAPSLAEDQVAAPPAGEPVVAEGQPARPAPRAGPKTDAAQEGPDYGEEIEVVGHYQNQVGTSTSASAGSYTSELIEDRPLLRPGEVLELVPGLIVTQHSGAGKANQYFLRGFNLDHGTDFATHVEGIPVNLPTNAHGQGYMDLNFLIPELISHADYWKGPYYAQNGDFSSAGAEDVYYAKELPRGLLLGTLGSFDYARALGAGSTDLGGGKLLFAFEAMHENGPWEVPENFWKLNGVLRWTRPVGDGTLTILGMGYFGQWTASDQVAQRAVTSGEIGYFGSLSPSDGGSAHRYSLSAEWEGKAAGGQLRAYVYAVNYQLALFSNFTYFLVDPINGDQMEQAEHRWFQGTSGSWAWSAPAAGMDLSWRAGWDGRLDEISPVALYHTVARQQINTWSSDDILEANGSLWAEVGARLTPWLHAILGLRGTLYYFNVQSNNPFNSGTSTDGLLLPKATVTLGPWAKTEVFLNFGEGYHSNDARGVTSTVDAKTGLPIKPVTALPKSWGAEVGARTQIIPNLQTSLDFWALYLDSELIWDADNGTTTPSAPTRRLGIEWANSYQPIRWLVFDLNVAWSQAIFTQDDPTTGELAGQPVPEAIGWTVAAGATIRDLGPWSASLFLRYFGPRVLCTEGTCGGSGGPQNGTPIWSTSSTLLNGQVSCQLTGNVKLTLEVLNVLNARVDDIAYYYQSRLPWESPAQYPQGVWDYQVHPAEPLQLRGTVTVQF
ncbi:MAG TPA: TonB-dependent receptor plug domain-containing protein [Anaeromyxobacteraceae bacterium]|nr:TonB-dependent receptor plug domain-containing protein [Anaeromyxobacteraceae bacterium]